MICARCRRDYDSERYEACPGCGEVEVASGVMKTSTILIASGKTERAYRSLDEIPIRLRKRLLRCTRGLNSATILIADRRGREELAKAVRKLPPSVQDRWLRAIFGARRRTPLRRCLTPARRRMLAAVMALITFLAICLVWAQRWFPAVR